MKRKIKYLIAAVLTVILVACTATNASALAENDKIYPIGDEEIAITETNESTFVDVSPENADTESTEINFFTEVYEDLSSYAGEILCALTFIGSMVLAIAYKKGLLPLIEKSLVAIASAVAKIKETTGESKEQGAALGGMIENKLTVAENSLISLAEKIDALAIELSRSKENDEAARLNSKQLLLVVNAQIDMLYDVFMSSALPQYQKDEVGEKIAAMKEAIAQNDVN